MSTSAILSGSSKLSEIGSVRTSVSLMPRTHSCNPEAGFLAKVTAVRKKEGNLLGRWQKERDKDERPLTCVVQEAPALVDTRLLSDVEREPALVGAKESSPFDVFAL